MGKSYFANIVLRWKKPPSFPAIKGIIIHPLISMVEMQREILDDLSHSSLT